MVRFPENPNPKADIAFVITYPFFFFVFKNIYKHVAHRAEFIIDLGIFFPITQPTSLGEDLLKIVQEHNVHYRVVYHDDYYSPRYLESFSRNYKALVSCWYKGFFAHTCNQEKKLIITPYGAGKELTTFGFWKSYADLLLAYGERGHKMFSLFSESVIVGNPKFDDWFNDDIPQKDLALVRETLDLKKRTVVYLPTHSDLSSVDQLASELGDLKNIYNVIAKPHHYIWREEEHRIKALQKQNIPLFKDDVSLMALLKYADVVVSDNSSVIFDAILADKPLVLADFWTQESLDVEHKEIEFVRRGPRGALTYSGSIEQKIKKDGTVVAIKSPSQLKTAVEEALNNDVIYKPRRDKIRTEIFAFNDGRCGERAAQAIEQCMASPTKKDKPFLVHLFEAYQASIKIASFSKNHRLSREIARLESVLDQNIRTHSQDSYFSVILIRDSNAKTEIEQCSLRALLEQEFPHEKYEVLVAQNGRTDLLDHTNAAKLPASGLPSVTNQLPTIPQTLGAEVSALIKQAKGEIVCFTTSVHRVPSDWLRSMYISYEKNLGISGVGGYIKAEKEGHSIFHEYFYLEMAKKMNVHRERSYLSKLYEFSNQLFDQNPAGTIANISYKKNLFDQASLTSVDSFTLEMEIKRVAINKAPLLFIPMVARSLQEYSFQLFLQQIHMRGVAHRLIASKDQYNISCYVTVFDALRAFVFFRPVFALVLIMGRVVWLSGRWRGSVILFLAKITLRLQDWSKSLHLSTQ